MFDTLGPFDLQQTALSLSRMTFEEADKCFGDMWISAVKQTEIRQARGVYIVATGISANRLKPWYVGKTDKSFPQRLRQHLKAKGGVIDQLAGKAPNENVQIFLLARVTSKTKKFVTTTKAELPSIQTLEDMLIASSTTCNPDLLNKQRKQFYLRLVVPGYLDKGPKGRHVSAKYFAKMINSK